MLEYRVTKYDPALRDSGGAYTRAEWISVSDIGRSFGGVALTQEEYQRVEDAYSTAAVAFLREGRITSLRVAGLESHGTPVPLRDGSMLALDEVAEVVRRVLREEFWCRLEGLGGFVHIGYDYYMYIGVPQPCPAARALAGQLGLFIEELRSPYSERDPAEPEAAADRPRD